MELDVICIHGWAYTESFWEPLQKVAPFSVRTSGAFQGGGYKILCVHSFGSQTVAQGLVDSADLILLMQSFARFPCPQWIDPMLEGLQSGKLSVLERFYKRAGAKGAASINEHLLTDLRAMKTCCRQLPGIRIAARQDLILGQTEAELLVEGPHAWPNTQPKACAKLIQELAHAQL